MRRTPELRWRRSPFATCDLHGNRVPRRSELSFRACRAKRANWLTPRPLPANKKTTLCHFATIANTKDPSCQQKQALAEDIDSANTGYLTHETLLKCAHF